MGTATAQVAIHAFHNFSLRGLGILQQQAVGIQDHARRTKTALEGIVLLKGFLQGMNSAVAGESFDGQDLFPFNLLDRQLTGTNRLLIDQNRAGSAKAGSAAVFGSGKVQIRSQNPQ